MRYRYLVAYDVSNPSRLRRTRQALLGFGDPLQYSVFLCDLSDKERVLMESALSEIIQHREDRVLIVRLGPANGRNLQSIKTLGRQILPAAREVLVI